MENVNFYFEKKLLDRIIIDDKMIFCIYGNEDSINIFMYLVGNEHYIGTATIATRKRFMEGNPCYYVHSVSIEENLQNKGYGTMLMKVVVEWLKKCHEAYGLDFAMLFMTKNRLEDKIRFYQRVGFVLTPYKNRDLIPMFYSFNEKGNEVIKQLSVATQEYQKAYKNEMSFFHKKAKILSKKELYDLLYKKVLNLPISIEYEVNNGAKGKFDAYVDVYCSYINDLRNFSWCDIYQALLEKWKHEMECSHY